MRGWKLLWCAGALALSVAVVGCQAPPEAGLDAPVGEPFDDSRLTSAVTAQLYALDGIDREQVDVEVQDSVVTLRGTVPSEEVKQSAVLAARSAEGVTEVQDLLRVDASLAAPTPTSGELPAR